MGIILHHARLPHTYSIKNLMIVVPDALSCEYSSVKTKSFLII